MKNILDKKITLQPWQVTGLVDGEGAFIIYLNKTGKGLTGFTVKLEFKVTQMKHSEGILFKLKEYFGCGSVVIDNRKTETMKFHVTDIGSIFNKIIPHFESYPCLTSKFLNFRDWKEAAFIINKKDHLTLSGMLEIIKLHSKMNTARSFEDKYDYCKTSLGMTLSSADLVEISYDLPNEWVQTFIAGEGMFYTYMAIKKSRGIEYQGCDSSLEIGQNSHDVAILLALKKFFKGGYIKPKYNYYDLFECKNSRSVNRFILRDTQTIIQFVDQFPMLNRKCLDYADWKSIVELKNLGQHKTVEGKALIIQTINQMNSKR